MRKLIYLKAIIFLIIYFLISKLIFLQALISQNILVTFISPMVFGALSGVIFLYLFSHEDFFRFAKIIETKRKKSEKKLEHVFIKFGKIIATFFIGTIGGPIFAGLSARVLIPEFYFKYLVVVLSAVPSTIFTMGVTKGAILLILK